jgi:RNA polymerase sigma-70 factor (ECF subfamily)
MAARITRAKRKIAAAGIPYRVPAGADLPDRLDAVLSVVHLLFTTGHTAPTGDRLVRTDLVERALHLGRTLHTLLPDEREVTGLLALMVVTDARRATRAAADGSLLLLEDQDRRCWDRGAIAEGRVLVVRALRGGRPGRFALQAAIASLHAEAPTYEQTDWPQILRLYDVLLTVWPSPVVALNRAVAVAMVDGLEAGLESASAAAADPRLARYPYAPAARADLLRRLGRTAEAAEAYRAAIALTANDAERDFLTRRLADVTAGAEH